MRDHSHHIQVTREEAISAILGVCDFHPGTQTVSIAESYGRVLAEDVCARMDMPNALTCAMDSIAVHWDDFEGLPAENGIPGIPDTSHWQRGVDWEFANTGVAMPDGFDTAIVVEHATISDDELHVSFDAAPSRRFAGTEPAGSTFHEGDLLVPKGTLVTPLLAAHMLSGNNVEVPVISKPKVAFIPTGNELVEGGGTIPHGRNIESNGALMRGKIVAWGGEPIIYGVVPDDPPAIEAALRRAVSEADIVVLNAGSSKGSDDWSLEILERIGHVLYHQTNHGPGHHSSCSVLENTPVIGISGPPGGAAFTTDFYLRPAMMRFLGLPTEPIHAKARLTEDLAMPNHRPATATAQTHVAAPAPAGEERPREVSPAGQGFQVIRQMVVRRADDGMLEATPLATPHPAPLEAESASAYFYMETGPSARTYLAGEIIDIDLRPDARIV